MLEGLRDFFATLTGSAPTRVDDDDPRVAAAALLFHVAEADGGASDDEALTLRRLLADAFALDPETARRIEAAGQQADAEAVDLFRFTSVLMRHLPQAERVRFVALLWQVVFVDDEVHELEDNVVWRIAELLGVSARDRMEAKRDAALRRQTGGIPS